MANLGYIQLVRTCNQHCLFCSNPDSGYRLELADALKLVDDFVERGYAGIVLTGGEPTLYAGLPEVIRHATALGIGTRMITNGQLTANPEYSRSLFDAGLTHVHVSIHSLNGEKQAFLTGNPDSLENLAATFDNLLGLGVAVDVNITMEAFNAGELDATVKWLVTRWPALHHFVFNNLDPTSDRVAEHPEVIPKLWQLEVSLFRALAYLESVGRTYRVERLPLCYMAEFAHASTETRKIVKGEERIVHFLDDRGMIRQTSWKHGKGEACRDCQLEEICAGLVEMDRFYSQEELYPVFVSSEPIKRRILSEPD